MSTTSSPTEQRRGGRTLGVGIGLGVLVLAVLAVTLIDTPAAPARPGPDGVLEVTIDDFAFDPEAVTLPAGEPVTLVLVNHDDVTHHISFGREVVEEGQRVVGYAEDLLEGLETHVEPAESLTRPQPPYTTLAVRVPGGQQVALETVLPEDRVGEWEMGCFTSRGCRYRAGLHGTLTVE